MALSKVTEIEIDSLARLTGSNSSSDFEIQLPYSYPNYPQSQIQLGTVYIPNSWYNITSSQSFIVTVNAVPTTVIIPAGSYTVASLVAALTTALTLPDGTAYSTISVPLPTGLLVGYQGTLKKVILQNKTGFNATFTAGSGLSTILSYLGFSTTDVTNLVTSGLANNAFAVASNVFNVNQDRDNRFYIRISTFENKILLPRFPTGLFTFAVNLRNQETGASFSYITVPQDDQDQTLILSHNQIRSNSVLKVQLVDHMGTVINLNGREWKFVLRVEEKSYACNMTDY